MKSESQKWLSDMAKQKKERAQKCSEPIKMSGVKGMKWGEHNAKDNDSLRNKESAHIGEAKKDFHGYIKELGLEKAKKIMLENTVYREVKDYVKNYKGE